MQTVLNSRILLSVIPPLLLLWIIRILWKEKKHLSSTTPIILGIIFLTIARVLDVFLEQPSLGASIHLDFYAESVSSAVNIAGDLADTVGVLLLIYGFIQTITSQIKQRKHITELEKLLPICATCKKIRKEDNTWESIEAYLHHTGAPPLTHGICPECKEKMLREIGNRKSL